MKARIEDWKDPKYAEIYLERRNRIRKIRRDGDEGWRNAFKYYSERPVEAIEDWFFTYDPRKVGTGSDPYTPLILFEKQREYIRWLQDRLEWQEEGVVEKSRDMGVTWVSLAFAWWLWTFNPGANISFGSRKESLVDKLNDPDSIFEKLRLAFRRLPKELLPNGWNERTCTPHLKIINPENGATITGEAGKNIGRGGRSTMYFLDEAAYIENPDSAEKALSENTDCKIYVSTPNGTGNPFYRKRFGGVVPVFTFHWRHDPRKGEAWYKRKKEALEPETLAQEVDLDYEASASDTVVSATWVRASIALRKQFAEDKILPDIEEGVGGLDVGGGGAGKSVFISRYGVVVEKTKHWSDDDTTNVAGRARELATKAKCPIVKYDSISVGRGVTAAFRRMEGVRALGVNVGDRATRTKWPDGKRAKDRFINLKAELWWTVRDRLRRTYEHWLHLAGEGGVQHEIDDLLLLPDDKNLCSELVTPRYMFTETGKIQIESKKSMATRGIASPDHADALILTFAPTPARAGSNRTVGLW